jgi:hypothetical protein
MAFSMGAIGTPPLGLTVAFALVKLDPSSSSKE